jgi:hypothetical protein
VKRVKRAKKVKVQYTLCDAPGKTPVQFGRKWHGRSRGRASLYTHVVIRKEVVSLTGEVLGVSTYRIQRKEWEGQK